MRTFHRLAPPAALALAIFAALAGACGDNTRPQAPDDAGIDGPPQPQPLAPCLDRPTDLPRPPAATGQLPCELLPPGFVAR